jgi:hypothetical protein
MNDVLWMYDENARICIREMNEVHARDIMHEMLDLIFSYVWK